MECFNYFFFLICLLISLIDLRPGVIINSPAGEDVHKGVFKDYTRDDVNVDNFLAISLVKIALTRYRKNGNSGPNDHIYIFTYSIVIMVALGCLALQCSVATRRKCWIFYDTYN